MTTLQEVTGESTPAMNTSSQSASSDEDRPPTPPPKDTLNSVTKPTNSTESYFRPLGLTRTDSIYTLSRASFSDQLLQLTSLNLPEASSLSSSVSSIPTATAATKALSSAAIQIQKWIQKAAEVLGGLDAEDDAEWAAAGGREGLEEVDASISRFESLVEVYVTAIEELQRREDISKVSATELKAVVDTMDTVLAAWENVKRLLKDIKQQVELAMEWEELWNVVLGDIGQEMDSLTRLVFEMEEKRHKAMSIDANADSSGGIDIQELETIVEESPIGSNPVHRASHRFSLPPTFLANSPLQSPVLSSPQDDSSLLALFARMQPLRASLDFLPMRLSSFQSRAEMTLPTAYKDLESRRGFLEKKWKTLQNDAETLRRELGEDRWVMVFRNAGRKVQKMCESVERSVGKLQDAINAEMQHSNPAAFVQRVEAYDAKHKHYGPAIPRVLAIIQKGVNDRLTVNGEVLRLHADTKAMWMTLEADMKDMDMVLEHMNSNKSQQMRDSISTIGSNDFSTMDSTMDTPGSSPASSVATGPVHNGKLAYHFAQESNETSRRSSMMSNSSSSRPFATRRNISLPHTSPTSGVSSRHSPKAYTTPSASSTFNGNSPRAGSNAASTTPTPQRPTMSSGDEKPRWNSSPKIEYKDNGHNFKPISLTPPSPYSKTNDYSHRKSRHFSANPNHSLPSPLGREHTSSPGPSTNSSRSRHTSVGQTCLGIHTRRHTSPSPAGSNRSSTDVSPRNRLPIHTTPNASPELPMHQRHSKVTSAAGDLRRQTYMSTVSHSSPVKKFSDEEDLTAPSSNTARPKLARPATAMAGSAGRRSSMLPISKTRTVGGQERPTDIRPESSFDVRGRCTVEERPL